MKGILEVAEVVRNSTFHFGYQPTERFSSEIQPFMFVLVVTSFYVTVAWLMAAETVCRWGRYLRWLDTDVGIPYT